MRNLKRALSLAMAAAMLIGMMVVGASAAGFPDSDKIEHTDAVNTMVALGIIKGNEDGTFDPERVVTRAEMAKMICVALNGGKDPNLTGGGLFPDTVNNWASGYIDYCANLGIVSGDNTGKFNPTNTVTGVEAAKMLLIALGFNAENEKYVNDANWSINIGVDASSKNLYEDLAIVPTAGLTRDQAAQMIWNGMQAVMVEYDYQLNTVNGNLTSVAIAKDKAGNPTILSSKFKMDDAEGVLQSYTYSKDADQPFTYTIATSGDMAEANAANKETFTTEADYTAMVGQKVKVLFKAGKTDEVYGMYDESGLVLTTTKGDMELDGDKKVKVDGTKYDLADVNTAIKVYNAKGAVIGAENLSTISAKDASTVKLVSSDKDKKIDLAIVTPVDVQKVTYVGSKSITAGKSYTFKDNTIADGIAKNDFVTVVAGDYTFDGKAIIEKAETVSGTVETKRGSAGEIKVEGVWYKKGGSATVPGLGDDVTLVVVGGYYYDADIKSETVKDVLYVKTAGTVQLDEVTVVAYFTDGTTQRVVVTKVDGETVTDVAQNTLYTYKVKDGKYELTALDNDENKAGYDTVHENASEAAGYTKDAIGGKKIADDAVIFVQAVNSVKVLTGKQVKDWGDITFANDADNTVVYATDVVNGFDTVKLASLYVATADTEIPGAAGDQAYGYVVSENADLIKEGDDYFVTFQIWNGETILDVKEEGSASSNTGDAQYTQGAFITYDALADGEVENVAVLATNSTDKTVWGSYAVTGIDQGNKDIALSSTGLKANAINLKLTKDTKIFFVNTADQEGVASEAITMATETAVKDAFIKNAWALMSTKKGDSDSALDAGDEVLAIFVDMSGLDTNKGDITVPTAAGTYVTAADKDALTATIATGATEAQIAGEVAGWTGAMTAGFAKAGDTLATNDVMNVVAEDGTVFSFVLTVS